MVFDVEEKGTTCKSDDLSNMRVATSSRTMFSVRRLRRRRGGGAGLLLLVDDEYYDDDEYLERGGCGGGDRHSDDAEGIGVSREDRGRARRGVEAEGADEGVRDVRADESTHGGYLRASTETN